MLAHLERPSRDKADAAAFGDAFGGTTATNAFVAWIFTVTAPLAIILSVGTRGGLSEAQIASWVFGVFCVNGVITLAFSGLYRQPLGFAWTIPGTVLVGPALAHLAFSEVVGAFVVTGVLILLLGLSGWVKRAMQSVPMPIVMGMVAGVFLRFGVDLVRSLHEDAGIAVPMVTAYLVLSAWPSLARRVPPLIGSLAVGVFAIVLLGRIPAGGPSLALEVARPMLQVPAWSWPAMAELVLPLAITVLVVQNGQGVAVLRSAGHEPPVNALTVACGLGSLASGLVGGVSSCLTGPSNAILVSSGERRSHFAAAMIYGLLTVMFGLFSPVFTRLFLQAPKSCIAVLAGLALLRVLQSAFATSFKDRFTLGALVSFLVTVCDLPLFSIGAAFWGLVAGLCVSGLLERQDFRPQPAP